MMSNDHQIFFSGYEDMKTEDIGSTRHLRTEKERKKGLESMIIAFETQGDKIKKKAGRNCCNKLTEWQ